MRTLFVHDNGRCVLRRFDSQSGTTALAFGAREGRVDCVRLLIDAGADKESADKVRDAAIF